MSKHARMIHKQWRGLGSVGTSRSSNERLQKAAQVPKTPENDLQNTWKNLQHKEQLQRTPVNVVQGPEMCEGGVVVDMMGSNRGKAPENAGKFAHKPVQGVQVCCKLPQRSDDLRDSWRLSPGAQRTARRCREKLLSSGWLG